MQSKYIACVYLSFSLFSLTRFLYMGVWRERKTERESEWETERQNLTYSAEVVLNCFSEKGSHTDLSAGVWEELVCDIIGMSLCDSAEMYRDSL